MVVSTNYVNAKNNVDKVDIGLLLGLADEMADAGTVFIHRIQL